MSRRRLEKPSAPGPAGDKPSIEQLLDMWEVRFLPYKTRQMIKCPIHGDTKSPSCSINLEKQLFNCHSCGEGGDAWTLLMKKEGIPDFGRARDFARAAELISEGSSRGGSGGLSGVNDDGSGSVSVRPGDRGVGRAYEPTWRRRGAGPRA